MKNYFVTAVSLTTNTTMSYTTKGHTILEVFDKESRINEPRYTIVKIEECGR